MNIVDSAVDRFVKENGGISPFMFSTETWLKDVEFRIPLYQRLFVWEDDQIIQLLEDLVRAFQNTVEKDYFIGTLTVYRPLSKETSKPRWDLVDGQQRMTVLALLGACFYAMGGNSLWRPFLFAGEPENRKSRLQYFARPKDQQDLGHILEHGLGATGVTNAHMNDFLTVLRGFLREMPWDDSTTAKFADFVGRRTKALVSFLPEKYGLHDLNFHFEKMNSTGKQLELHEILKVRYFHNFSSVWNAVANGSRKYEQIETEKNSESVAEISLLSILQNSANVDFRKEPQSETEDVENIRLVVSFPIFLLHSLAILLESRGLEINLYEKDFWDPRQLLSTFQWAKERWGVDDFAEKLLREMTAYREWMDEWIIHLENGISVSPDRWKTKESHDSKGNWAYRKPVWQFQAMLYVSSDERQKWIIEAYRNLRKIRPDISSLSREEGERILLQFLKQRDWERHGNSLPKLDSLEVFCYGNIDRYWFWKLDYILWEKVYNDELSLSEFAGNLTEGKWIKAVKAFNFRRNRSIEHLHPQTSENPWVEKHLHSFGNLAMISSSFNSAQGNDRVATKFGRMSDRGDLESIKLLFMFFAAKGKDYLWNQETAAVHGLKMAEFLLASKPECAS